MTVNDALGAGAFGTLGNLPAESNVFVGRARDLADLIGILERARSLTLCGPGGIGKTRLAAKLAASLAGRFPDGVWIADQAEAEDSDRLVPLLSNVIGIRSEPDRPLAETLADALAPRTMLLILDTCEHLVQESAELVEWLLGHCPKLRVIATSTEPLRMRGEVIWRVPPLGLPGSTLPGANAELTPAELAESEAVQLFAARAAATRPGFELTEANVTAIAEICRTLEGVPLAIELAAARLRTLTVDQIRLRLASRFELLAIGDRTAPRRQQTLLATVEWSYDLLTEPEKRLLCRLSVFHGWSLELAEQVCSDGRIPRSQVLDLLTALIDKSLVSVDYEGAGEVRYRLLDTVRQFAADRAEPDELSAMRRSHRDAMLSLAESMIASGVLLDGQSWQGRISAWHQALANLTNFHLALAYCAEHGEVTEGLRLCNAVRVAWLVAGDFVGASWLDKFLRNSALAPPGIRSYALVARSEVAFEQHDFDAVAVFANRALDFAEQCDDGNLAGARRMLAVAALADGQLYAALGYIDAAIAAARQQSQTWEEGVSLAIRAAVLASQGDLPAATAAYQQAFDTLGESRGWAVANVRYRRGRLARTSGDAEGAERYFSSALALYRQVGARPEMARCLSGLGQLALERGDLAVARTQLVECAELSLAMGQRVAIARSMAALAELQRALGDLASAVRLAATARKLFAATGITGHPVSRVDGLIDAATADLGQAAVTALLTEASQQDHHQLARQAIAALTAASLPARPGPAASERPAADKQVTRASCSWPGPLTERQREIAVLVAAGGSNRAIAEQLSITEATAARHIANIYDKLGFNSRAQLIGWVMNGRPTELARS